MHPTRIYARVGLIPSRMISKNTEGTYSDMSLEEKESLYEEIYKPGIIDDMYGLGFIPMMADYSLLPHVALFLFEIFKDKPLHPLDTEKCFVYPENYTVASYTDYPDQNTIQRLLFTGRILEHLNKARGKFSIGFDYDFVKTHLYQYRLQRVYGDSSHSDLEIDAIENLLDGVLRTPQIMKVIDAKTVKDRNWTLAQLNSYLLPIVHNCKTKLPTLIPRNEAQKYLDEYKGKYGTLTEKESTTLSSQR
jgi:hypothetical protein